MSYVTHNYTSKRALKEDVKASIDPATPATERATLARRLTILPTSIVPGSEPVNGTAFLEGPHYPAPHRWYAKVQVTSGVVTRVIS